MFSYVGSFLFFLAGFLHGFKKDNCWSCNLFINWFISYLGTRSSCNVCKRFLRIFCSSPIALLPSCQPGADGAFQIWEKLGVTARLLPGKKQHQPQVLQFLLGCCFCAKLEVTSLMSKYMNRESCGSHHHQACVYTHTHCGTGPAAGSDLQNYLLCKWLTPPFFHCLYHGVSIIWSGLLRSVSDTFFSQQVRVGLKIILDRTTENQVLHGPEWEWCGADPSQISERLR